MSAHSPLVDLIRLERLALRQHRKVTRLRDRLQDEQDLLSTVLQASVLARAAIDSGRDPETEGGQPCAAEGGTTGRSAGKAATTEEAAKPTEEPHDGSYPIEVATGPGACPTGPVAFDSPAGQPREHRCGVCSEPGHNAQTCPTRGTHMAPSAAVKRCVQCREVKGLEEFYLVRKGEGARQSRCKTCDCNMRLARGEGSREHAGRSHKGDTCGTCHSMPSRVEGPSCPVCGLAAEKAPRAEDFTSGGESALGRAIG